MYWEYIPAEVVKTLLTSLIQKHAWDGSNNEVRLSVIKVCSFIYLSCVLLSIISRSCHPSYPLGARAELKGDVVVGLREIYIALA